MAYTLTPFPSSPSAARYPSRDYQPPSKWPGGLHAAPRFSAPHRTVKL